MMREAGIDVGGVEYVIDDATGRLLYYDINALSNFVADPERVIGFNPYARLADYLIAEAGKRVERRLRREFNFGGVVGTEEWTDCRVRGHNAEILQRSSSDRFRMTVVAALWSGGRRNEIWVLVAGVWGVAAERGG